MRRLYLDDAHGLRREDLKKAQEVSAALGELARFASGKQVVEAAAGHAYVSLLGAELLGWRRVWLIERDPGRAARCREIATRLPGATVEVRAGEISDPSLWPPEPDLVIALHACGAATDDVIAAAIAHRARHLWLVPCCYARAIPAAERAEARADTLAISRQAEIRRRLITAFVDSERTLTLEAAGWEVTVAPFVPVSVTPHNLVFRARRVGEPHRMSQARTQLHRLLNP